MHQCGEGSGSTALGSSLHRLPERPQVPPVKVTVKRYGAHVALERLEWIERHVKARPENPETEARLEGELAELQAWLLRVIGGTPVPEEKESV